MDRAPLRLVPSRPAGPVAPDAAVRHAAAALPGLDEPAVRAFGLVALAGTSRAEAASAAGLTAAETAAALSRARKALRRASWPLPGSGWCERAERLISDRIDGELEAPGPARLDVHLRNCARCVEHERRLVQATDALVASFPAAALPSPQPPPDEQPAPPLSVVRRERAPAPAVRPFGAPVRLEPRAVSRAAEPFPHAQRSPTAVAWGVLLAVAVGLAVLSVLIAVVGVIAAL